MCIRDRPEPWIPLPANGSQNHHHIPPAAGERETCTHATASTTGGPHTPRSAGPFPSPKYFLCPLYPITEPAGGPLFGRAAPRDYIDVHAALASHRYSHDQLLDLAKEHD